MADYTLPLTGVTNGAAIESLADWDDHWSESTETLDFDSTNGYWEVDGTLSSGDEFWRTYTHSGNPDAYKILAKIRVDGNSFTGLLFGVTRSASGSATAADGYRLRINSNGGRAELSEKTNNSTTALGSNKDLTLTGATSDVWLEVLFNDPDETNPVVCRAWVDGDTRPASADWDINDTTHTGGDAGIYFGSSANDDGTTGGDVLAWEFTDLESSGQTVVMEAITDGETMYSPGVSTTNTVAMQLISDAETLFEPTVVPDQFVEMQFISEAETLYSPAVALAQTVEMELISDAETLYAPEVIGPQYVGMILVAETETLYQPAVSGGGQVVEVPLLSVPGTFYEPNVSYIQTVSVPLLSEPETVYEPTLAEQQTIVVPNIFDDTTLFEPAVSQTDTQTLPELELLSEPGQIFTPTVLPTSFLPPTFVSAVTQVDLAPDETHEITLPTGLQVNDLVLAVSGSPGGAVEPAVRKFPTTDTTGFLTSLTSSGSIVTTADNQIIENLDITGYVDVNHNNVTIRNCRITATDLIESAIEHRVAGVLTVEDCIIDGAGWTLWGIYSQQGLRCYRNQIRNTERGIFCGFDSFIDGNLIWQLDAGPSHWDLIDFSVGVYCEGGSSVWIYNNRIEAVFGQQTSAIWAHGLSAIDGLHISNNLLSGGSTTLWVEDRNGGITNHTIHSNIVVSGSWSTESHRFVLAEVGAEAPVIETLEDATKAQGFTTIDSRVILQGSSDPAAFAYSVDQLLITNDTVDIDRLFFITRTWGSKRVQAAELNMAVVVIRNVGSAITNQTVVQSSADLSTHPSPGISLERGDLFVPIWIGGADGADPGYPEAPGDTSELVRSSNIGLPGIMMASKLFPVGGASGTYTPIYSEPNPYASISVAISAIGVLAQLIESQLITDSTEVFDPGVAVTTGAQTVDSQFISEIETLFAPLVGQSSAPQQVEPPLITQAGQLFAPIVAVPGGQTPGILDPRLDGIPNFTAEMGCRIDEASLVPGSVYNATIDGEVVSGRLLERLRINANNVIVRDCIIRGSAQTLISVESGSVRTEFVTVEGISSGGSTPVPGQLDPNDPTFTTEVGTRDASVLTAASEGFFVTSSNGQVIEGRRFSGARIEHDNVIFRDCYFNGNGTVMIRNNGSNLKMEYCTLEGIPKPTVGSTQCIGYSRYHLYRCDISGASDGCKVGTNTIIEECWVHDLGRWQWSGGGYTHNDCVQATGSGNQTNIQLLRSYFEQSHRTTSCVKLTAEQGSINGVIIDGNRFRGGNKFEDLDNDTLSDDTNYGLYLTFKSPDPPIQNVTYTNNTFVMSSSTGYEFRLGRDTIDAGTTFVANSNNVNNTGNTFDGVSGGSSGSTGGTTPDYGLAFSDIDMYRCDVSGVKDGVRARDRVTITECYFHDLETSSGFADGIQANSGSEILVVRTLVVGPIGPQSAIKLTAQSSDLDSVNLMDNVFYGGSTSLVVNRVDPHPLPTNATVLDNAIVDVFTVAATDIDVDLVTANVGGNYVTTWDALQVPSAGQTEDRIFPPTIFELTDMFPPGVESGSQPVGMQFILDEGTIYQPQVVPAFSQTVSLASELIAETELLFTPEVARVGDTQTVQMAKIDAPATLYTPSVVSSFQIIEAPLLITTTRLFLPGLSGGIWFGGVTISEIGEPRVLSWAEDVRSEMDDNNTVSSLSTQYVNSAVYLLDQGEAFDPTGYQVEFAFTSAQNNIFAEPDEVDWVTGSWIQTGGVYYARCLIGPSGNKELADGAYKVWVRAAIPPQTLVFDSGILVVT